MVLILTVCFFAALFWSVWARTYKYRQNAQVEPKISPISLAVQELIAIAGGIYLSLITVVSFLKIIVPEKMWIGAVEVDPLAFFSICLGIVQPVLAKLIKKVK